MSRKFKFHQNLTRITGALCDDLCTFMIYRLFLVRMRNAAYNHCIENQNTHFMFNIPLPPHQKWRLWDNVEKYGRTIEATALCMLGNLGCRHTLRIWHTYCFSTEQALGGRVLSLILRRSRTGTVWFYTLPATREQHDQNCTQSH